MTEFGTTQIICELAANGRGKSKPLLFRDLVYVLLNSVERGLDGSVRNDVSVGNK